MLVYMTANDHELLGQFIREAGTAAGQDAFAALVNRHLNLVHSAARRQVRSPELAEEVCQTVFAHLARKAAELKPETVLSAWLYQATRYTAIDVVRREARRQAREQIAFQMSAAHEPTADWTHIEPLLDEAMQSLEEPDRTALLLRYFENKSLREVGQALGASEDAAQKRVSRAVERLREFFGRRKMTVGASGLVALVSAHAVQAAPAGLAGTIAAGTVVASAGLSTSTAIAATKTIAMTTLQKTIIGATLAVAVGTGVYEATQNSKLRNRVQTLQRQQEPLQDQVQQLQRERDAAAGQVAALQAERDRLSRNSHELLRLRGEVGVLRQETNHVAELQSENRKLRVAAARQAPYAVSQPEQFLRAVGWGTNSCRQIASRYSAAWLTEIADPNMLIKLGLALYDAGNYQRALNVFQHLEGANPGVALVWQGQMLDLLGRRDEALAAYTKAAAQQVNQRHDQYGLALDKQYIQQRIETPFKRVENQMTD